MNPPLGPDGNPVGPDALAPVFPMNLIEQEVSTQRWIDIPEKVLEMLAMWRPAPLVRAYALEEALGTPARIYYKNESVSPAGSHKPNTAVAQAYYNKEFGIKKLTTETGAGQWGSALSFACSLLGLECKVFMVRVSFDQKPFRKMMMEAWGGSCIASPSDETQAGRNVLAQYPDTPGSLGIAISEAVEAAVTDPSGETRYSLGSVLNHVMLHQTIIGLEAKKQLEKINEKLPDVIIGCAGGGSNFAGISFPFMLDKINGADIEIIPVEPASCPTLTKAPFAYDHGDLAKMTPLLAMNSLGHGFIPPPIHAGGLRYHGMSPLVCHAVKEGLATPQAIHQLECYEAGNGNEKVRTSVALSPASRLTDSMYPGVPRKSIFYLVGDQDIVDTGDGVLDFPAMASELFKRTEDPKKMLLIEKTNAHGTELLESTGVNEAILQWFKEHLPVEP